MVFAKTPVVVVWDGAGGNLRRRALYPPYKMNRVPLPGSTYESLKLIQETLRHTPVIQVSVPTYEADDVIATLSQRYARSGYHVGIFSNDADFLQLGEQFPQNIFCGAKPLSNAEAKHIRTYKTCVGDVSDNISGIKGFGKGGWAKADKSLLQSFVSGQSKTYDFEAKHVGAWVRDNEALIRTMYDIVGFYDVPMEEINKNSSTGTKDYAAGNLILERYFL